MPTVTCPNHQCGKSYIVSDESLGGRARCKTCGSVIELMWGDDQSDVSNRDPESPHASLWPPPGKISASNPPETITPDDTESDAPNTSGQSQIPETLGRFQIQSVLGAGTFGTVYRAYDPQLDREVALKVPNAGVLRTEEEAERFLREARAAASLRHPNICPVYDVNEQDGRVCIVMAFISGKTLSSLINPDKPLGERQAALLVHKLAQALDLAHQKGVVHRDLKPGNIMFDQEHREPVIMDFGLARRADSCDAQMTQMGQILGTPAYMSPEQAMGQTEAIGPASDVYSLGVIFYELLCCARPFPGSAEQVRAAHYLKTAAEPPSTHRSGIDPTLEAICRKSISREITDRSSMAELAAALSHYLRGPQSSADVLPPALPPQGRPAATAPAASEEDLSGLFASVATDGKRPPARKPKSKNRRKRPTALESHWQSLPPVGKWGVVAAAAALLIVLLATVSRRVENLPNADAVEPNDRTVPLQTPALASTSVPRFPQRLWVGFEMRSSPSRVTEFADYTNIVLDRGWNVYGDTLMTDANGTGHKVVVYFDDKQLADSVAMPLIDKHHDTVVAVCWEGPYFGGHAGELTTFGESLKTKYPWIQFWISVVEKEIERKPTLVVPDVVDVVLVTHYGQQTAAGLRQSVDRHLPGWIVKASGRPVLLRWTASRKIAGGNVPDTTPETFLECAKIVQDYKLAGVVFAHFTGAYEVSGYTIASIDSKPQLVTAVRDVWAELTGISFVSLSDKSHWTSMETSGPADDVHRVRYGGWNMMGNVIRCETLTPGWLRSNEQYDDFELSLGFKLPPGGNSGIYIRSPEQGRLANVAMEVQLVDDNNVRVTAETRTGAIHRAALAKYAAFNGANQWNDIVIRCQGEQIQITLNGTEVVDVQMNEVAALKDRPRRGYIGISNWRGEANGAEFRNVRIRRLN